MVFPPTPVILHKSRIRDKEHIRIIHNPGLQAGIFWPACNLYFSLNGISYAQQQKHHLPSKFPSIINETEENQRKKHGDICSFTNISYFCTPKGEMALGTVNIRYHPKITQQQLLKTVRQREQRNISHLTYTFHTETKRKQCLRFVKLQERKPWLATMFRTRSAAQSARLT